MNLESLFCRLNTINCRENDPTIKYDHRGDPYIPYKQRAYSLKSFNSQQPGMNTMFHSMSSTPDDFPISHDFVQRVIDQGFVCERRYASFSRQPMLWQTEGENALLVARSNIYTSREYNLRQYIHWAESLICLSPKCVQALFSNVYEWKVRNRGKKDKYNKHMWQYIPKEHFLGYLYFACEQDSENFDRNVIHILELYRTGAITELQAIQCFLAFTSTVKVHSPTGEDAKHDDRDELLLSYIGACLESVLMDTVFREPGTSSLETIKPNFPWTVLLKNLGQKYKSSVDYS